MLCWRFPALCSIGSHLPFTVYENRTSSFGRGQHFLTANQLSTIQSHIMCCVLYCAPTYRWSRGLIRGIQFEANDEYWSMNLKKGVIGLLQVSLRQHQDRRSISRRHRYSSRRSPWRFRRPFGRHSFSNENTDPASYLVMEVRRFISFDCTHIFIKH